MCPMHPNAPDSTGSNRFGLNAAIFWPQGDGAGLPASSDDAGAQTSRALA
jgi:hypothetical protein